MGGAGSLADSEALEGDAARPPLPLGLGPAPAVCQTLGRARPPCYPTAYPPRGAAPLGSESVPIVSQQQNFKQKVVALLRRFKVSDEVSDRAWTARPSVSCVSFVSCVTRVLGHLGRVLALRLPVPWPPRTVSLSARVGRPNPGAPQGPG